MSLFARLTLDLDGTVVETRRYIATVLQASLYEGDIKAISSRWAGSVPVLLLSDEAFINIQLRDTVAAQLVHTAVSIHRNTVRIFQCCPFLSDSPFTDKGPINQRLQEVGTSHCRSCLGVFIRLHDGFYNCRVE